jgi:membrane protease YdiL (CAAX protease family)
MNSLEMTPPKWWEACLDCFIIYVLSSLIASMLIMPVLPPMYWGIFPGTQGNELGVARYVLLIAVWLAVWSFMLWLWVKRRVDPFDFMLVRKPKSIKTSLLASGLVLLPIAAIELAIWYSGWEWESGEVEQFYNYVMNSAMAPMLLVTGVIGAPVAEELMFRGYLQSSLERTWIGFWGAAILLSSVWGLYHPYAWEQQMFIFGMGVLLALLRRKTGSIIPGMMVHGIVNLFGLLAYTKVS